MRIYAQKVAIMRHDIILDSIINPLNFSYNVQFRQMNVQNDCLILLLLS